ncbi:Hypothetical protein CINCED_3A023149 [Cinara cedri]|uniref:Uncharacterized protein n=1 Tax=Cinara cedri TaxID=506608 RepID=A0A5E4MDD6_9HEMI|nr:Hypothetical protein CINCED_3A023149 [Cinara cedri]
MSTKEAKNDVAVDKIAENDVADAKADLKGTKRTADDKSEEVKKLKKEENGEEDLDEEDEPEGDEEEEEEFAEGEEDLEETVGMC